MTKRTGGCGDTLSLDLMEGQVLAERYRLVRILGSGAMGQVYEAEQIGLGRSVAVKLMRIALLGDPDSRARFETEALAASRVNHPNAIAIFDFGVTSDGVPYLVMEQLAGRPLSELLAETPMTPRRAMLVGLQVLAALEEAHSCRVIHCDLKSENINVDTLRGGRDFVKVFDFGIARLLDQPRQDAKVSGTPEYMAPELIRGAEPSPAVDLYAVGVILYEMLVGRTPFAGNSMPEVLHRHVHEPPPRPDGLVPDCPAALSEIILRALEKVPEHRFPDAASMRAALEEVVAGLENGAEQATCPTCGWRTGRQARFCPMCGAAHRPEAASTPQRAEPAEPAPEREPQRATRSTRRTHLTCIAWRPATPLTDRSEELDRIVTFARGGERACTAAIVGPPGIGKSRLVLEAASQLSTSGAVFVTAPDPSGCQQPWYPVLAMLEAILELPARPSVEDVARAAARCGLPERDAPGLALLFGLPSPLDGLELAVRRREVHATARRALTALGARFERLLTFLDVDRYDAPSRRLVEALALSIDGTNVRLLVTARQAQAVPPGALVLSLRGLEPADALQLFLARIDREIADPPSPAAVHDLTAGSPSAIEHLAGWYLLGHQLADAPTRLVDLVAARLGHLTAAERRVLQGIAIHGQVAPREVLQKTIADVDPAGDALRTLVARGLVAEDGADLAIVSSFVAEVVAACTPADVRQGLARAALEVLGDRAPRAVAADLSSWAGNLTASFEHYLAAGDDAVVRLDDPGAAQHYWRAIATARRQLASGESGADQRFVDAALRLADVLRYTGELRLAAGCLDEAKACEMTLAQRAVFARARARIALAAGDAGGAREQLRGALGLGYRAGDRDFLCETYIDIGAALVKLGDMPAAIRELTEAVNAVTLGIGLREAIGPARLWQLGLRLAELHFQAGDARSALRVARDTLAHAERARSPGPEGRAHALLAAVLESQGDTALALDHRTRALAKLRALGDRRTTAELLIAWARCTLKRTPAEEASRSPDAKYAFDLAGRLAEEVGWHEGVALASDGAGPAAR
jgi:tetratricopeptide (TPR) repeat protein